MFETFKKIKIISEQQLIVFLLFFLFLLLSFNDNTVASDNHRWQFYEERAKQLVVKIRTQFMENNFEYNGSGFIFSKTEQRIYIATARHVVFERGDDEKPIESLIEIQFKFLPGEWYEGKLLNHNYDLDLAVVKVDLDSQLLEKIKNLPFDIIANERLKRRQKVFVIGNPGGRSWWVNVMPYYVSRPGWDLLYFEAASLPPGVSGGVVINQNGALAGMVIRDNPPEGIALPLGRVIDKLRAWGYPVDLRKNITE